MTEYDEMRMESTNIGDQKAIVAKWIYILLICNIVSMIVTALNAIPPISGVTAWISRGITVVMIVALFNLAAVNERYRKAAVFSAVVVGGGIAVVVLELKGNLFTLAISICALIANYQELNAHSELVASMSAKLSKRWHSLFYYELVVGLVTGLLSSAAVVIAVFADVDAEVITTVTVAVLGAINVILGLFRIVYLKQTLRLYQE